MDSSVIEISKELYHKLHFYLGCPIKYLLGTEIHTGVLTVGILQTICPHPYPQSPDKSIRFITLYLKEFNSLEDEEFSLILDKISKRFTFETLEDLNSKIKEDSEMFVYLLSIHYDLFNLINNGLVKSQNSKEYQELCQNNITI